LNKIWFYLWFSPKLNHEELLNYIKDLQKRLVKEKPKKNSSNSSIAPSTDMTKPEKNQTLREESDRKVGGQQGREGKNLAQTDEPDSVAELDFGILHQHLTIKRIKEEKEK
jgi:hypothetical protein